MLPTSPPGILLADLGANRRDQRRRLHRRANHDRRTSDAIERLRQRHVGHPTRGLAQALVAHVRDDADDLVVAGFARLGQPHATANRIGVAEVMARRRLIQDRHLRGACPVFRQERPSFHDAHAERVEVGRS